MLSGEILQISMYTSNNTFDDKEDDGSHLLHHVQIVDSRAGRWKQCPLHHRPIADLILKVKKVVWRTLPYTRDCVIAFHREAQRFEHSERDGIHRLPHHW